MKKEASVRTAEPGRAASSTDETPFFFAAGDEMLFGIHTQATGDPVGTALIALPGGGYISSTHRNRMWVRLCRAAAADGLDAVRFDYHGVGESSGVVRRYRLDEPFVDDLIGAVRWVEKRGIDRVIAVGTCFGGRTALAAAEGIPGLAGLVLISCPVRDFGQGEKASTHLAHHWSFGRYVRNALRPRVLKGLLDSRRRRSYGRLAKAKLQTLARGERDGSGDGSVSPNFLEPLSRLIGRGVPVLFVYGTDDMAYEAFLAALGGRLGKMISGSESRVEVETVPGLLDGFPEIAAQELCLTIVRDWISGQPSSGSEPQAEEDGTWTWV